jgi:hypothetical protein
MVHPHLPHWAEQVFDDVEHQGELQTIGFVLTVTMLLGTLVVATIAAVAALLELLA